jgi:hypothetical protein
MNRVNILRRRDSAVYIATRYMLGGSSYEPVLITKATKRPWRETDHTTSSAEIKNQWSYSPTLPTCHQNVDRDNYFTVTNMDHGAMSLIGVKIFSKQF